MPERNDSYERGQIDGKVAARLESHDGRLDRLEGLSEQAFKDINGLVLATRHLEEASKADKETAIATAKALADAERSRRDADEEKQRVADKRWGPWARFFAAVGAVVGVLTLLVIAHGYGLI